MRDMREIRAMWDQQERLRMSCTGMTHRQRHEQWRREETWGIRPVFSVYPSQVYYIERDGLIKIGTTACFTARMKALKPDRILALEQGSTLHEAYRHRQFRHLLVDNGCREWFYPSIELLEHIRKLQQRGPVGVFS